MIRNTSLVLLMGATCTCAWAQNAPVELSATTVDGQREAPRACNWTNRSAPARALA